MSGLADLSDADLLASLPRGVRNNNPLNLKTKGTAGQDGDFAVYGSMDEGIAAADRNLQAYHTKHGINTVSGVVNRWAPPNADGNHTANYIAHVAKRMNVAPDAQIDMVNPETRRQLIGAMGEYENGVPVAQPAGGDVSSLSDAELMASLGQTAPKPTPQAQVAAVQASLKGKPQVSQALGFGKGAFAPVDHAAGWLERGIRGTGLEAPLSQAGAQLRKAIPEGALRFIDNPAAFYADKAKQGVVPGKIGEFAGNVAGTAFVPGGPLVQGAVGGALLSDKKDVGGVLGDAAFGGIAGRLTAGASDALQIGARKALSKAPQIMGLPALEAAKKAAYKAVDASGFTFPATKVGDLASSFEKTVGSSALSKSAKDDAHSIIDYTRTLAKGDLTLSALEKLRGDIYQAMVKKGGDTGVIGGKMRSEIDRLISSAGKGNELIQTARGLNARWAKADYITRMSKSADRAAERTYGGDYGRKLKDRLNPLVDEAMPNRNLRGGTPDEMAAIDRIVRGTKTQNFASTAGGMLDPRRLGGKILAGATTAGGGAGALATGGASLLVPAAQMAAGFGLTGTASKIARNNLDDLVKLIAAGGSKKALAPVPTKASHATEVAIAKILRPVAVASAAPGVAFANEGSRRKSDPKPKR